MRLCGPLIPPALPMGDAVGQVFADGRVAVTNVPHDVFGQPQLQQVAHTDPVTFRLLRWSGAGECRESRDRRGARAGLGC
jgi:hypothetical protein